MKIRLRRPLGYPMLVITTGRFYRPYVWLNRLLAVGRRRWEILFLDDATAQTYKWLRS